MALCCMKTYPRLLESTRTARWRTGGWLLLSVVLFLAPGRAGELAKAGGPDWSGFLGRHDPVWERLPQAWHEAPFLGNGWLGTLVRQVDTNAVRWDVGHSQVHDHRQPDDYRVRAPEILNRGRMPIGHFRLRTQGSIRQGEMRLELWNAEARGSLETDAGRIRWRTLVHARDIVCLVEVEGEGGETGCRFEFVPEAAESCRMTRVKGSLPPAFLAAYPPNPEAVVRAVDGSIHVAEQDLVAGGQTTTAWSIQSLGSRKRLWFSVAHRWPARDATDRAVGELQSALAADPTAWVGTHRAWWHAYYPQAFVSLSDPYWEGFYWLQMYKLACATRADRALIDNQGPWLQPGGWNGTWWNLNVQLSYSAVATANRLELGQSLVRHLREHFTNLVQNVAPPYRDDSAGLSRNTSMLDLSGRVGQPGGWEFPNPDIGSEVGNLAWTCHNLDLLYRHSRDSELRDGLLYPLLRRAINYYRHFLVEGQDGRWHLPPTHSPEYRNEPVPDCNYDLALIRWGCQTLIGLARERSREDELLPVWQDLLARLTEYPTNEHGFMIGRDLGYDRSHRHWSHLLMIYPLRLVTPENGGEALIRKSLERWHALQGAHAAYSYTGAACMAAMLGDGDLALRYLEGLKPYLVPVTQYREGGGPVIETPLHGAAAVQDLLLQSWGGVIRVFPAVPSSWPEAVFSQLRAEGGFLVSALRRDGRTRWVRIQSLAGQPCRVRPGLPGQFQVRAVRAVVPVALAPGLYELPLLRDEVVDLHVGEMPDLSLGPVGSAGEGMAHGFGLKRH